MKSTPVTPVLAALFAGLVFNCPIASAQAQPAVQQLRDPVARRAAPAAPAQPGIPQLQPLQTRLAAAPASAPAVQAKPLPAQLQPFIKLAQQCSAYNELVVGRAWKTVYHEDFKPQAATSWKAQDPDGIIVNLNPKAVGAPEATKLATEDGRDVLLITSVGERAVVEFGPKVKGDFAIEFVGKALSERICDLSVFVDANDHGPGFQFGAHYNTQNKLWVGPVKPDANPPQPAAEAFIPLPADTLIQPGAWHRVRLELREGQVVALVDGKLIGKAPVGNAYDRKAPRQPVIYAYSSQIAVDQVTIESMAPAAKAVEPAQAWTKAFGDTSRDQVKKQLNELVDFLADDKDTLRDGAETLIRQMGILVVEPLEYAAENGLPEQQRRAKELLEAIRPAKDTPPATAPTPTPAAATDPTQPPAAQ